jgi:hypothetical protein
MTAAAEKTRLAALADAELPLRSLKPEVLAHLRRPFAPAAVKWKVQTETWKVRPGRGSDRVQGAILVAYIDARLVLERLNLVWPWWREEKTAAGQGAARCTLWLYEPGKPNVVMGPRSDIGMGGDAKTVESDALKRAAVHFGIGVSIYALATVERVVGPARSDLRVERRRKKKDGKWVDADVPVIDADTLGWLTEKYAGWLEEKGELMFGPVLDHGDEPDAQGLDEESPQAAAEASGGEQVTETQDPGPQPLEDERAVELRTMIEGRYAQFRKLAPRKMTPAVFQQKLREASVSHEDLEAFDALLEKLVLEHGGDGRG